MLAADWAAVFGMAGVVVGHARRRSPAQWGVFGAVLGPVALALLLLAPPGRCGACDARVVGWARECEACGEDVASPRRDRVAPTTDAAGPSSEARPRRRPAERVSGPVPAAPASAAPAPSRTASRGSSPRRRAPGTVAAASAPRRDGRSPRVVDDRETRGAATRGDAAALAAGGAAPPPTEAPRVLASGVCITGAAPLLAGCRYEISVDPRRFRVVGPVDQQPGKPALEVPIRNVDATSLEGRVVITERVGSTTRVLGVFTSIAGSDPARLADAVVDAAAAAIGTAT